MRILILLVTVILLSLLGSNNTHAYFMTAGKLFEVCSKAPIPVSTDGKTVETLTAECFGYISGIHDGLELEMEEGEYGWVTNCLPQKTVPFQLAQGVLKYLKEHPENYHFPAALEVAKAIETKWCKKE